MTSKGTERRLTDRGITEVLSGLDEARKAINLRAKECAARADAAQAEATALAKIASAAATASEILRDEQFRREAEAMNKEGSSA